jgi:putative nucleotidyltransferase with HDIG domain
MRQARLNSVRLKTPRTVLVVDDNSSAREMLVDVLEAQGQHCITAANAAEAIERLAECCVDLVLSDIHMPGQSGIDLLEYIHRLDDSIPVIMITGYPTIETAVESMKRGAVEFIPKPYDLGALTHAVGKALRERELRQENRRLQANKAAVIERLNRELNSKLEELTRLYAISEGLTQFMDTEAIFNQVVRLASETTGAQRVSLMLLDRARRHMTIRASIGIPEEVVDSTRVEFGQGIAGQVVASGAAVRVIKVRDSVDVPAEALTSGGLYSTSSWLSQPLYVGEQIFGVLNLTDKLDRGNFSPNDEHIMRILLEKAGTRLENQALYEGIYANLVDTLNSLVTTIEAKDPYTRRHSQRVTDYSLSIAEELGLPEDQREMLEFAGVLHDIGKIGVHDEILTKSGRLTDEEYEAIKQHPLIGERIVEPLGLTPVERAIIRNHHERIDGLGYPDGLRGDRIPFLARLLAVADSFDAMTTTRSYRHALSMEAAKAELIKHRGTQFDPVVVDAALAAIERGDIYIQPFEKPEEEPVFNGA